MNDREFLTENQFAANNTEPAAGNSYADLDFSGFNADNYQDDYPDYSQPASQNDFNPFSSDVEAPGYFAHQEEDVASPDFFGQEVADLTLDSDGFFHDENDGELGGTEATGVSRGDFAGDSIASQDEINSLIDGIVNDDELEVDRFGRIRNASSDSGLQGTAATGVSKGGFAGDSIADQEEINRLMDVVNGNQGGIVIDRNGTIYGADAIHGLHGTELTGASVGDFAAQWYQTNPRLYNIERALMNRRFPQAKEIKMANGNLAWQIKMDISSTGAFEPWTFLLVYKSDHPNNNGYGGSVKVIPLRPNLEQLQERVKESKGKYFSSTPPVPHVVKESGSEMRYLCTRAPSDIADGSESTTSAVQVAAWAAEWALYFELAMRDNRVWNKWVDDAHFRKWKIT